MYNHIQKNKTMKKIYIAPELVTVKINLTSMLCESSYIPEGESEDAGYAETREYRFSNIWEDDRKW